MHLMTGNTKHYDEELESIRISQYLLHWFNKLFICILCGRWNKSRGLCAETEEEPHTCNSKWAKAQTQDLQRATTKHVPSSKQHWKLAWRLTGRHEVADNRQCLFGISHRLVHFQVTDDSINVRQLLTVVCIIPKSILQKVSNQIKVMSSRKDNADLLSYPTDLLSLWQWFPTLGF